MSGEWVWVVIEREESTGRAYLLAVFSTESRALAAVQDDFGWKAEVIKCRVDPT